MASCWAAGRIADRVGQSLSAFESLEKIEAPNDPEGSRVIYIQEISDQQSKFKIWAGNIGAHRTGRSSLDYRLRDSSHLHTQVMRILDDLVFSLNEGLRRETPSSSTQLLTQTSAFNPNRRISSVG